MTTKLKTKFHVHGHEDKLHDTFSAARSSKEGSAKPTRKIRQVLVKEDCPTNSMGASSATSGPIVTYDPLLRKPKRKLEPFSQIARRKKDVS